MKSRVHIILLSVIIFAVAFGAGFWISAVRDNAHTENLIENIKPVRENNFDYQFVFPFLRYDFGNAKYYLEDKILEQKITGYVQNEYDNQKAQSISVYISSLSGNSWAGVNADAQYHPGSMMKVLIMIAYYRQDQLDPSILNQNFVYTKTIADQANAIDFNLPSNMIVGKTYGVKDLITNMIENSDNGAETLLLDNSNQTILNDIYHDLNIEVPSEVPDFTISAKNYSTFLRILYNTTYLTDADSEQALSLMSHTTFTSALVAGIPSNIVVSHKYGERVDTDATGAVTATELHDCGIVYAENPYTICVMTKGYPDASEADLASIIKDISALVYNYENTNNN